MNVPLCPDCAALACHSCAGWALDEDAGLLTLCACEQAGHGHTRMTTRCPRTPRGRTSTTRRHQ